VDSIGACSGAGAGAAGTLQLLNSCSPITPARSPALLCGAAGVTFVFVPGAFACMWFDSRRAANRLRIVGCNIMIEPKRAMKAAELMTMSTTSSTFGSYSGFSVSSFIIANPTSSVSMSCNDVRKDSQSSTISSNGSYASSRVCVCAWTCVARGGVGGGGGIYLFVGEKLRGEKDYGWQCEK
jgi:hypothetical protein